MAAQGFRVACIAVLSTVTITVGSVGAKTDPLTIRLSAHTAPARADVIVQARVEPDARSRELIIEWVADDLSGGLHAISLDGDRSPVVHQYPLKDMAPGQYVVTAILRLMDGSEIRRKSNLSVVGVESARSPSFEQTRPEIQALRTDQG